MKWKKLGLIFNVENQFDWMCSHASLPIAQNLNGDIFRIYFSSRDSNNRSNGAYIDIDILYPDKILNISDKPILEYGEIGSFDESGSQPCCIVNHKNDIFLYFTGWSLTKTVPYKTCLGLYKNKQGSFIKYRDLPILDFFESHHKSIGYTFVTHHNNLFKMWCEVNDKWVKNKGTNKLEPHFVIKYATSKDGIDWRFQGGTCIHDRIGGNIISRPSVIIEDNIYKMWYSYKRNGFYAMGYAESRDGLDWQRKDQEVGIETSKIGWDSEQIEYPYVFDHKDERYMLYNGNGYGRSGFGLAKLKK